jgi:hypothetical protein
LKEWDSIGKIALEENISFSMDIISIKEGAITV